MIDDSSQTRLVFDKRTALGNFLCASQSRIVDLPNDVSWDVSAKVTNRLHELVLIISLLTSLVGREVSLEAPDVADFHLGANERTII